MEKTKFRCHFSIIFENTAAVWIFLAVALFGQLQNVIEFATSLEKEDMWAVIGGFLGSAISGKVTEEKVNMIYQWVIILVLIINIYNAWRIF